MEGDDTSRHFDETTMREREYLKWSYGNYIKRYDGFRGKQGLEVLDVMPQTLSFVPNISDYRFNNTGKQPWAYFDFISNYGFGRMQIWFYNREQKLCMVDCDLYTQGHDGNLRGMGKKGSEELKRKLQIFADQTGYTMFNIITANMVSKHLLDDSPGLQPLSDEETEKLRLLARQSDDEAKFENALSTTRVAGKTVKVETIKPNPAETKDLLEDEKKWIKLVKDFMF